VIWIKTGNVPEDYSDDEHVLMLYRRYLIDEPEFCKDVFPWGLKSRSNFNLGQTRIRENSVNANNVRALMRQAREESKRNNSQLPTIARPGVTETNLVQRY